jgi:hypothetical protein
VDIVYKLIIMIKKTNYLHYIHLKREIRFYPNISRQIINLNKIIVNEKIIKALILHIMILYHKLDKKIQNIKQNLFIRKIKTNIFSENI